MPARRFLKLSIFTLVLVVSHIASAQVRRRELPNGGFEEISSLSGSPRNWSVSFGKGTRATIAVDSSIAHSGKNSIRISDQSPTQANIWAQLSSAGLEITAETTYAVRGFIKGKDVGKFFVGADFGGTFGEYRQTLPAGSYDWKEFAFAFTMPAECKSVTLRFTADGLTESLWLDDLTIERSARQLANLSEKRYPKTFDGWFPRTPGPVPEHLVVADVSRQSTDVNTLLVALQGIVNRNGPRLYLINQTNPLYYDEVWLTYMKDKGYTGEEEWIKDPKDVLRRFRTEITGSIIYDPEIPGSINAAWMLAGLKNALPASDEVAKAWDLPVVEDLRGKFKRNVDAYRYVYDNYWDRMNHFVLAWHHPRDPAVGCRDSIVQWNVFTFWISAHADEEKGCDPIAEEEFVQEVLANTPGNVPVMGWMKWTDKLGVEEYTGARMLSEYGKWIPGTGYSSNVSVHSAIQPKPGTFKQKFRTKRLGPQFEREKVYIATDVIDSGDAHWYFQFFQRKLWADPLRGSIPTGYCMNMTLCDTLPLVAQWYYENMTENESFFGFLYINAPVYASKFRPEDRERIWTEYVQLNDEYCQKMDIDGLEIYAGGNNAPAASDQLLRRFTRGMKKLDYILAGLGRHADVTPENANYLLDNTVVFQTLTNFHVWSASEDTEKRPMGPENEWLLNEIRQNTPGTRPGFISAMAISWTYYPSWVKDLHAKLPGDYVPVSPSDLARLYRESGLATKR